MERVHLKSWTLYSNASTVRLSRDFSSQIVQVRPPGFVCISVHALVSSVQHTRCKTLCSSPASASKLIPEGFGVEWGPLVSAFVISIVTTFDALFLHPKQMSQRAPAMKLWDGTFRFAFLYGVPWLGPHLQSKGRVRLDILKAHRMRLPQPYQRSMFQVSTETEATEDQAFSLLRSKIVEKFTEEEHSLFETPEGRFFTKGAKGVLMEITLDVRPSNKMGLHC